jgi:hypothetical protein
MQLYANTRIVIRSFARPLMLLIRLLPLLLVVVVVVVLVVVVIVVGSNPSSSFTNKQKYFDLQMDVVDIVV